MIYLPNHTDRWWTWDENQPLGKTIYTRGIGFYSHQPVQMTFYQRVEFLHGFILRALEVGEPMEQQIYNILGYRDMTRSDLEYTCRDLDPHWQIKSDVTIDTGIRRLLKQGKITRKLHARGWFQWYVYSRVDDFTKDVTNA